MNLQTVFKMMARPALVIVAMLTASHAHAGGCSQWLPGPMMPPIAGTNGPVHAAMKWTPIGQPPLLIIGGEFTQVGGAEVNNIAAWDGQFWRALGNGINTPGSLGYFRRAAPTTWTPVMTLSPAGNIGIGTNGLGCPLHVVGNGLHTARFANSNATSAVVELQITASNAIWKYGVAGTSPPLSLAPGSMYIFKQGWATAPLSITPAGVVRRIAWASVLAA